MVILETFDRGEKRFERGFKIGIHVLYRGLAVPIVQILPDLRKTFDIGLSLVVHLGELRLTFRTGDRRLQLCQKSVDRLDGPGDTPGDFVALLLRVGKDHLEVGAGVSIDFRGERIDDAHFPPVVVDHRFNLAVKVAQAHVTGPHARDRQNHHNGEGRSQFEFQCQSHRHLLVSVFRTTLSQPVS
ncbi:hypothetical protein TG4357_02268 [Thalassovita gelatinovora]|uniref:Uncharacterized protein n=1 Tax=Thalassovita gelatinovora TaxID=53501 RepID=A0A0P1G2V8_THAGE|nr:hypothetical protein TG4357_02268 [Thalassovita gelatinovora]